MKDYFLRHFPTFIDLSIIYLYHYFRLVSWLKREDSTKVVFYDICPHLLMWISYIYYNIWLVTIFINIVYMQPCGMFFHQIQHEEINSLDNPGVDFLALLNFLYKYLNLNFGKIWIKAKCNFIRLHKKT